MSGLSDRIKNKTPTLEIIKKFHRLKYRQECFDEGATNAVRSVFIKKNAKILHLFFFKLTGKNLLSGHVIMSC